MCSLASLIVLVALLASGLGKPNRPPNDRLSLGDESEPFLGRPEVTPEKLDQLITLLQLAKQVQSMKGGSGGSSSSSSSSSSVSTVLSSVANSMPSFHTITGPISTVGSVSYNTLSSTASAVTYFLLDYVVEPLDMVGVKDHLCTNPSVKVLEDIPTLTTKKLASDRSAYARSLSRQIARVLEVDEK